MRARVLAGLGALGLAAVLTDAVRPLVGAGVGSSMVLAVGGSVIAAALGGATPAAVGLGASGALAYVALRPSLPLAAAALLAMLAYGARAVRARDAAAAVVHLALASLAGAASAWVLLRHGGADPITRSAAVVVATLLVSAPFALHVEDPRVVLLARLARSARGPARARLLRAAALRRRSIEGALPLARTDRRRMERAFDAIARLAEARIELGVADARALDRALAAHVGALARWTRAVRARWTSVQALSAGSVELAGATDAATAEAAALDELAGEP